MYTGLFKTLQLTESNLTPYVGTELYGFNRSSTKSWGYVERLVTFGEGNGTKTIKITFLVIDCTSLYNCIIGRTGLAQLGAACSTTLHGDLKVARRCFLQANKIQNSVSHSEQSSMDEGKTAASTLDSNLIELNPRFTKSERKELKKEKKDPLNVEILRLIPDEDFELISFGDDSTKCFKLGKGILEHARAQLIAFLRENADLFPWSAADMPDIDPSVACYQFTVSPSASVKVRKTTRGGGGLNCVFKNFSFLRSEKLFPDLESEIVQSLSAADNRREKRKKEHKQLYRFLPQTGSSPVPLALPRRVPLKCNVGLQVAQSHKKETSQCSWTTPRDFYAQSHKKETSMLKDNSKRLHLLNHY